MTVKLLKQTEFLNFSDISEVMKFTGKTKIIGVGNNSGEKLGIIKWKVGWRRYTFEPYPETVWDCKCLTDIIEFINELMEERKCI